MKIDMIHYCESIVQTRLFFYACTICFQVSEGLAQDILYPPFHVFCFCFCFC